MANPFWQKVELDPDLKKHPNGTYYVDPSTLGPAARGQPKSTGEKDFRRAVAAKREMIQEYAKLDPHYIPTTYPEVAEKAWTVCQAKGKNRESTKREARPLYDKLIHLSRRYAEEVLGQKALLIHQADNSFWSWAIDEISKEPTEGIDPDTGKRWKKAPRKTFANLRKYAVQIDNFAWQQGFKKARCKFPINDPPPREGKIITDDQFRKILAATVPQGEGQGAKWKLRRTAFRMQAFLKCARFMGMRRTEILGLEVSRVILAKMSIRLEAHHTKTGSKTGKGREFAIAPECRDDILGLAAEAQAAGREWLFPNRKGTGRLKSVAMQIRRIRKKTGIDFRPHDLRHTFLTEKILVQKLPPMDVAFYAGVSLRVMEDVYLHPKVEDTAYVVTGKKPEVPALASGKTPDIELIGGEDPITSDPLKVLKLERGTGRCE